MKISDILDSDIFDFVKRINEMNTNSIFELLKLSLSIVKYYTN